MTGPGPQQAYLTVQHPLQYGTLDQFAQSGAEEAFKGTVLECSNVTNAEVTITPKVVVTGLTSPARHITSPTAVFAADTIKRSSFRKVKARGGEGEATAAVPTLNVSYTITFPVPASSGHGSGDSENSTATTELIFIQIRDRLISSVLSGQFDRTLNRLSGNGFANVRSYPAPVVSGPFYMA